MSSVSSIRSVEYPFVGLGFSATGSEAESIAHALLEGRADHLPAVDMLNVGVSTSNPPPAGLGALLKRASLSCVAHLEELNLVGTMDEAILHRVVEACESLQPAWLQEDLGLWVWKGGALGAQMIAPILDERSLAQAVRNVRRILEVSPYPFLAENPPFYYALGDIDLLTFMARLADQTGCGLLLDIGHLIGYCVCTDRDPLAYIEQWTAFDHLVEIHLAGYARYGTSNATMWRDSHENAIQPLALDVLDRVLERAGNVKAVTIEAEGARLDVLRYNVGCVSERLQPADATTHVQH
ncbi:MAG: DUF692 family multinuclear iron-containing protein [Myxococcota bacterium]